MLHVLQGHCNAPIAGHATASADGSLTLTGAVYSPDRKTILTAAPAGSTRADRGLSSSLVPGAGSSPRLSGGVRRPG